MFFNDVVSNIRKVPDNDADTDADIWLSAEGADWCLQSRFIHVYVVYPSVSRGLPTSWK